MMIFVQMDCNTYWFCKGRGNSGCGYMLEVDEVWMEVLGGNADVLYSGRMECG